MNSLSFFIGYLVGVVFVVLVFKYKQRKALKLMQQMTKSKSGNFQQVNNVTFADVESEADNND